MVMTKDKVKKILEGKEEEKKILNHIRNIERTKILLDCLNNPKKYLDNVGKDLESDEIIIFDYIKDLFVDKKFGTEIYVNLDDFAKNLFEDNNFRVLKNNNGFRNYLIKLLESDKALKYGIKYEHNYFMLHINNELEALRKLFEGESNEGR